MDAPLRGSEDDWEQATLDRYRGRGMRVGFAGTTNFMTMRVAAELASKIEALPSNATVVVRKARVAPIGLFEGVVVALAKQHDHMVWLCQPDGNGRAAVYKRDYELVENIDRLEAYFAPDRVMEGGTGHLVESAMARNIPVYAWTVSERGEVIRVGEFEPNATF